MILAVRARADVVLIDLPFPVNDISSRGADLDTGGGDRAAVLAVAALGWVEAMGTGCAGHERKDQERAH